MVHLSGAPIAGGLWTKARKAELRSSRIQSTKALVTAIGNAANPPPVLLSGSAIGWYGDTGTREVDESAPAGTGFLAHLVRDWEAAARPASQAGVRVVNLRSGVVLSGKGGMLGPLVPLFRLGLGARIGPGTQFISWISLTDHVAAVRFLLDHADIEGPVNLTAPVPATNAEFTASWPGCCGARRCCGFRPRCCAPGSVSFPANCWAARGCCRGGCRRLASRSAIPASPERSRPSWRSAGALAAALAQGVLSPLAVR